MSDLIERLNAGIDVANRKIPTLLTKQDIEIAQLLRETLIETRDEIERLPRLLTEAAVAEYLGVNPETVARERRRGRLPFRKVGGLIRYTEGDLQEYLDRCASTSLAYVDELRAAAGKVTCWRCEGYGELKAPYEEGAGMDDADPCPDCADLRALLAKEGV